MAGPRFIASSRYRAAIFHYWYIAEPRPRQSTGCSSIRDAISGDTTRCSFFSLSNINHESFQGCAQPGILPESPSIRQNRVNRDRFFFSLYPRREICPNGFCLPPLLILFYRWSWILKFIRVKRRVIGYGTSISLGIGRSSNLKNIFQLEKRLCYRWDTWMYIQNWFIYRRLVIEDYYREDKANETGCIEDLLQTRILFQCGIR